MEQQNGDTGGENATLDRVLNFFKELRRNSEWAQLHLETTVTGDLAVNLSVRCPAAVSSSGAVNPRYVFQSTECLEEMRNDFLDYYKVEIEAIEFLSSESCNNSCQTGFGE